MSTVGRNSVQRTGGSDGMDALWQWRAWNDDRDIDNMQSNRSDRLTEKSVIACLKVSLLTIEMQWKSLEL